MAVNAITGNIPGLISNTEAPKQIKNGFENVLTEFIGDVNQSQLDAQKLTSNFIMGDGVEIQDVMIAGEKAKTSLELLMEIRNKAVDMYKELTRIPV